MTKGDWIEKAIMITAILVAIVIYLELKQYNNATNDLSATWSFHFFIFNNQVQATQAIMRNDIIF